MKEYNYTVVYEQDEGGVWLAHIPALNGTTTQGNSLAEARHMAEDAIKIYVESCVQEGIPVPEDIAEKVTVVA